MTVRRRLAYLLALVLGVGAALLVACGDGTERGIPADEASALESDLEDVQQRVEDARCGQLVGQLRQVRDRIDRLEPPVDAQLRERLREGAERLRDQAMTECEENREATETQTTTTDTVPTETQTRTTEPAQTQTQTQTQPAPPPPPTQTQPPPQTNPAPPAAPPEVGPGGGTPPGGDG